MPVPIPLNECVLRDDRHLLWATMHSPHGATRPCVGLLSFDAWQTTGDAPGGCVLLDAAGAGIARIVPLESLGMSSDRARRLREAQSRHEHRAAREPAYARRWARRFREACEAADRA
jgi:hypothetical protein